MSASPVRPFLSDMLAPCPRIHSTDVIQDIYLTREARDTDILIRGVGNNERYCWSMGKLFCNQTFTCIVTGVRCAHLGNEWPMYFS